jgi:VWFA-related protein
MRQTRWLVVFLLLTLVLAVQAQEPVFRVRVDVPVVSIEAVVKDSNDRPLTHLTQADFDIYEDGERQEIRFFETADVPRTIFLIYDVTGVLDSQKPFMEQSMDAYFANMRPQDKVGVAAMGPELETLMSFRKLEPGKSVKVKLPPERVGSNIYESLDMGARRFGKEDTRRAMIIMTDGRDTFMFNETQRLGTPPQLVDDRDFKPRLEAARKRGVPYYFIALNTDPRFMPQIDFEYAFFKNADGYMRSPQYAAGKRSPTIADDYLAAVKLRMERLAEVTGGRVLYPRSLPEVVSFFERISKELGYSYSMGYSPKASLDDARGTRSKSGRRQATRSSSLARATAA